MKENIVNQSLPPISLNGGMGPRKVNPSAIKRLPSSIATRPSKPWSIRRPHRGVNMVYASPNDMKTSPVWEEVKLNFSFMKGSKEAEYHDQAVPENASARTLIRTPGAFKISTQDTFFA